ncbi:MAG TPA: DUF4037 domain-containing protein [Anaerolinea thermolimosa]|uniref:DUF4037 domain-containing protein n=1 Tax=Anaerolinea thermolimosa TaxID=229919 RepID=A0A3D1JJ24_9CHLR|nr:DUF4037 domain-containing protein [Anaerolinea thermolimosa]GAP08003.1 hypothetical protein ATHL_02902 [Anaerolinea thermolimosa]HCE18503.1 DUF4037 domain-containing protein [Anaerolinea thermolimosa]
MISSKPQPEFIPGLKLSQMYYEEAVGPLLARHFPGLRHTAALIGFGSDVLGFDDERSRDHMWGPRLVLFLPEENFAENQNALEKLFRVELPPSFHGYPTSFSAPDAEGVRWMEEREQGAVSPLIEITTLPAYFQKEIGWDTCRPIETADWLTFSEHRLLSLTSGGVWHDDLGLEAVRAQLAYYPKQLWMYLLAAQWMKIGQEEAFVGRTVEVGDEIGSRLITARLVEAVMRLCFLMERRYAPYSKWFGRAFRRLEIAPLIEPHLSGALEAGDFHTREANLCRAYEICAWKFNSLDLLPPVEARVRLFYGRPFKVIFGGAIAEKIRSAISDENIRALPPFIGSVNQFSASTDSLESIEVTTRLRGLYPS